MYGVENTIDVLWIISRSIGYTMLMPYDVVRHLITHKTPFGNDRCSLKEYMQTWYDDYKMTWYSIRDPFMRYKWNPEWHVEKPQSGIINRKSLVCTQDWWME